MEKTKLAYLNVRKVATDSVLGACSPADPINTSSLLVVCYGLSFERSTQFVHTCAGCIFIFISIYHK